MLFNNLKITRTESRSSHAFIRLEANSEVLLGSIPSFIWFFVLLYNEGSSLTSTTDVFIPFLLPQQNLMYFFSPWHFASFGSFGNAPLAYLYSYALESLLRNPFITQHLIVLFPIPVSYFSAAILLKKFSKYKILIILFANMYVFSPVSLNQVIGATGLIYIYAFEPLVIFFSMCIFETRIFNRSASKNVFGLSLSLLGATFALTEAVLFCSLLIGPLVIAALIRHLNSDSSKHQIWVFFSLLSLGFILYFALSIFLYFPWFLGVFFPTSIIGSSLTSGFTAFFKNPFAINGYRATFPESYSVLTLMINVNTPSILDTVLSVGLMITTTLPLLMRTKRSKDYIFLGNWLYLLLVAGFLQLIIISPKSAFEVFSISHFIPLLVFNEPAEIWFLVAVWELLLLYQSTLILIDFVIPVNYGRLRQQVGNAFNGENADKRSSLIHNAGHYSRIFTCILVAALVLLQFNSLLTAAPPDIYATSSQGETHFHNTYYGTYSIPDHSPKFVINLIQSFQTERATAGPFRVLWLPTFPGIQQWSQIDPYMISFPPSNPELLSYFQQFVRNAASNSSTNIAPMLSSLGIKYIVVLNSMYQNQTPPTIAQGNLGPYAIMGNPAAFNSYLSHQHDLRCIVCGNNYSEYLNLEFRGFFSGKVGAFYLSSSNPVSFGRNATYTSPVYDPHQLNLANCSLINLILNPTFSSGLTHWSSFGNNVSQQPVVVNGTSMMKVSVNNPSHSTP